MATFESWKTTVILGLLIFVIFMTLTNHDLFSFQKDPSPSSFSAVDVDNSDYPPTDLTHLAFGLLGSERAWHHRKEYIQSWWRPNVTRGLLFLDKPPTGGDLLPWSAASPTYRVSENLSTFLAETNPADPVMIRMVHGIMELFREMDDENLRWVVMGDDDSIFFVDNMVDELSRYDHSKYYYFGGQSEFVMSNYWFSFNQGFGGAGFMLSYPLAKALADDMENCLRRHARVRSADLITMHCIADIGVNLTPQKGMHQIDLRGDISGFLSSHPKSPLLSLHHLDAVEPIFPTMDRYESTRHLMKAAAADQSRMLQQTICYDRRRSWSFSISWGYSAHIYERIVARSDLQKPIETFEPWLGTLPPPKYMFNTRLPTNNSCETPHVFFLQTVDKAPSRGIVTTYTRAAARGLPPCGGHGADSVTKIRVISPATKRKEMDRSECCDIVGVEGGKAKVKFRECKTGEIIA